MMKKRSVTTDAIGLDDREVVWLDANIFRVVTEREGLRVMPAIGALGNPFVQSIRWNMAVVACRDRVMTTSLP